MMRRVDMRAGVHGHLNDVGDKTLVLPPDDRFQFEIFFIGRKRRGVAFFHRHAEIDDAHKTPPNREFSHISHHRWESQRRNRQAKRESNGSSPTFKSILEIWRLSRAKRQRILGTISARAAGNFGWPCATEACPR